MRDPVPSGDPTESARLICVACDDRELLRQLATDLRLPTTHRGWRHRRSARVEVRGSLGYFDELTVRENLALGLGRFGDVGAAEPTLEQLESDFGVVRRLEVDPDDDVARGLACLVRGLHRQPDHLVVNDLVDRLDGEEWEVFLEHARRRADAGLTTVYAVTSLDMTRMFGADLVRIHRGSELFIEAAPEEISWERARLLVASDTVATRELLSQQLSSAATDVASDDGFASAVAGVIGGVCGRRSFFIVLLGEGQPLIRTRARRPMSDGELAEMAQSLIAEGSELTDDSLGGRGRARPLVVEGKLSGWIGVLADADDPAALPLSDVAELVSSHLESFWARQRTLLVSSNVSRADAVQRLVGGIAHDFNNSLQSLVGLADLMAATNEDLAVDPLLRTLQMVAGDASTFVSKLLAFSRHSDLEHLPVDIHTVVEDAIEMVKRGLDIEVDFRLALDADHSALLGDESELRNVFVNLFLNSVAAFDTDEPVIEVSSRNISANGGDQPAVAVSVKDNGTGMSPGVADRVFEPFVTRRDRSVGTGLGLAVARATMREHGGDIEIHSTSPEGTVIAVSAPVNLDLSRNQDLEVLAPETTVPSSSTVHDVMVFDDDPAVLEVLIEMLGALGHRAVGVPDGPTGLRMFEARHQKVTICIVDQLMPKMNGDEVIRRLREIAPEVYVIWLSGYRTEVGEELDVDADAVVSKPIGLSELAVVLESVPDPSGDDGNGATGDRSPGDSDDRHM